MLSSHFHCKCIARYSIFHLIDDNKFDFIIHSMGRRKVEADGNRKKCFAVDGNELRSSKPCIGVQTEISKLFLSSLSFSFFLSLAHCALLFIKF